MQQFYQEAPRQIPIAYSVDVLVVGSGPAGFACSRQRRAPGRENAPCGSAGECGRNCHIRSNEPLYRVGWQRLL